MPDSSLARSQIRRPACPDASQGRELQQGHSAAGEGVKALGTGFNAAASWGRSRSMATSSFARAGGFSDEFWGWRKPVRAQHDRRKRLDVRVRMPKDRTSAIPKLEAVMRALAFGGQNVRPRNRVSVREAGWQHLDTGKVSIAQEIAPHEL